MAGCACAANTIGAYRPESNEFREENMFDILHRVGIESAPEDVHAALTTQRGLSGWWTDEVKGEGAVGDAVHFQFGERGFLDMKVLEADPGKRVRWQVVDGPREWIGTGISWELRRDGDCTIVLFKHAAGRSRSSPCTTAAPSGRCSCPA